VAAAAQASWGLHVKNTRPGNTYDFERSKKVVDRYQEMRKQLLDYHTPMCKEQNA